MYSIGDIVDKLVIENIKIFNIKESLNQTHTEEEHVRLYEKMMILNENRSILSNILDEKIERVVSGKERNVILKLVRTYT